jgi:hypothetical protein
MRAAHRWISQKLLLMLRMHDRPYRCRVGDVGRGSTLGPNGALRDYRVAGQAATRRVGIDSIIGHRL